jgi:uncharacterized integral membrane protein
MAAAPNSPACPNCGAFFPVAGAELAALSECPRCLRSTRVILFPAYDRPATVGPTAEKVVLDGEATCFYHQQYRALVPCDACGRFLCALCDLHLQGRHLCPTCLETAMKKGTDQSLERNRTRWDQIISTLLLLPLLFCYIFIPLTSLAALSLIVWKWKAPGSLVSNTRMHLVIYAIVAVLEFMAGSVIWWMATGGAHRR